MNDIAKLGFEIDSTPLVRAGQAAQQAAQQIGQVGTAADKAAQQTKGATQGAGDLGAAFGKINGTLKMSTQELQSLAAALGQGPQGASNSIQYAIGAIGRLGGALGPVGLTITGAITGVAALAGGFVALQRPLAEAADRFALMEGRMRNALGSTEAAQQAMAKLYEQTQKTGLGFQSAADAFLRIARNAETLGATQDQILLLSDTIAKLGKTSGASTGEIQSGMVQLGQALASGRLNGDELRSIMENMPALAKAIAEGLGVSVGQIRALGAAGELTSEKVFKAILAASGKANEEFAKLPDTVEQANQRVSDSFNTLLANLGTNLNSSAFMRGLANAGNTLLDGLNSAFDRGTLDQQINSVQRRLDGLRDAQDRGPGFGAEILSMPTDEDIRDVEQQLAALIKKREDDMRDSTAKQLQLNNAAFTQIVQLGENEFGDFEKKVNKARESAEKLEREVARIRQANPVMNPNYQTEQDILPKLERQAAVARAEFNALAAGVDKAKRSLQDFQQASSRGGGGGGTGIVQNALNQQREAQRQLGNGAGSLDTYIGIGVQDAAAKAAANIANMERQAKAQDNLAAATGKTRAEIRELEIAQEVANFRFQNFGTLQGPLVTKTVSQYEAALRKTKEAQDSLGDGRAFQSVQDNLAGIAAQMKAVEQGAYAMREAAAQSRAEVANRTTPGSGIGVMQEFGQQEQLAAQQRITQMERENRRLREDTMALGQPGAQRQLGIERQVEDGSRDVAPDRRREVETLIRERSEAQQTKEMVAQNTEIRRQIVMNRERLSIMGLTGEKLVVETMLLERRNQLEMQGIDLGGEQAKQILASTEELAKQQYQIQKAQEQTEAYKRVWTNAARMIQESLSEAFEQAFRKGEFSAKSFFNLVGDIALKVSSDIIGAMVYKPLEGLLMDLGTSLGASIFGPKAPAVGTSQPTFATFAPTESAAYGNAFSGGNVVPFARGGLLSQPTVFGMANGGSGVAGEAGSEAVLPLKRGLDGKLGVGGGGSGEVSITIIDQRSGGDSKPVEASESRGPDGQRMIQIIVRDEVRRAIRSGELDRDMQSSYGNQRRLVTR